MSVIITPNIVPEFAIALYNESGQLMIGLRHDGTSETGPNYNPDEAARMFWDAVAELMPENVKQAHKSRTSAPQTDAN